MKTTITLAELKRRLDENKNMMLIDVRSTEEYNEMHLPFAGNLDVEIIVSGNFIPESGKVIITICGKGGGRSERAANYLRANYKNEVYFLEGGSIGWFNT